MQNYKLEENWQMNLRKLSDRCQSLLRSGKFADCQFLVGTLPNQRLFSGHRLLLAMASVVFERMVFRGLQKGPFCIPGVEPNVFEDLLIYIYTDVISISSFDHACKMYDVAKRYTLSQMADHCINYMITLLNPSNAHHLYEYGKYNNERRLMETSLTLMSLDAQQAAERDG